MSEFTNKCVLLKGIPFHVQRDDVVNILEAGNLYKDVDKIQAHIERQNDKRWIVLFKTEEGATKCFNSGKLETKVGDETITAIPDFCSEFIIPGSWLSSEQENKSCAIADDSFSSISSNDLFAGASLPFQPSGSENDFGKEIKETIVHKNNLDEDEADKSDKAIAISSCTLGENIPPDSVLFFGSGRKIHSGLNSTGLDGASEQDVIGKEDCSTMTDFEKKGPGQDKSTKDFTKFKSQENSNEQNQNKIKDVRTVPISTSENAVYVCDFPKGSFPVEAVRNDSLADRNLDGHQEIPLQTNDMTTKTNGMVTKTQNRLENTSEDIISTYNVPKVNNTDWQTIPGEDNKSLPGKFDEPKRREVVLGSSDVSENKKVILSKNIGGAIQETIQKTAKLQPNITSTTFQEDATGVKTTCATHHMPAGHQVANQEPKEKQPEFPAVYQYCYGFPLVNMPLHGYAVPPRAPNQEPYYMPYLIHPSYIYPNANQMYPARPTAQYSPSGQQFYGPRVPVSPPSELVQMTNDESQQQNSQSQFTENEYPIPVSMKEDCTDDKERPKEISDFCFGNDDNPYSTPYSIDSIQHRSSAEKITSQQQQSVPPKQNFDLGTDKTEEHIYDEMPESQDPCQDNDLVHLRKRKPNPRRYKKRSLPPLPTENSGKLIISEDVKSSLHEAPKNFCDQNKLPSEGLKKSAVYQSNSTENEDEEDTGDKEEIEDITNKIIVTGFKETTSFESLLCFFESNRKSGGDEIVKTERKTDPDELVIEFKDCSVVKSLLQKQAAQKFKLDDTLLAVRSYIPPPVDRLKVFLRGLREEISTESLEVFVEVVTGLTPLAMDRGETPGTMMLTFDAAPDFKRFQQELKSQTLEDRVITASTVEVSKSVKVTGYDNSTTQDKLIFYFENKRSGGGEVTHIKMEKDRSIIQFRQVKAAIRVCDGRSHVLNDRELSVCVYYKCMDLDKNFVVQIPNPVEISGVNQSLVRFIRESKHKDVLEYELKQISGVPKWSTDTGDKITIACTLDPNDKQSIHLVKNWENRCTEAANKWLDTLEVNEDIKVQPEIWTKSLKALEEINVPGPQDVVVFTRTEEMMIVVVGKKNAVAELSLKIETILKDTEDSSIEETRRITKTVKLKTYQIALLNTLDFFDESNVATFDVTIEHKGAREVMLSGQKCNINRILESINRKLNKFVKKSFLAGKSYRDLMFEKEIRDYIKKTMMKQKVTGVWDVVRGDDNVYMYSKSEKQAQAAIDVVRKCLLLKMLPLDLRMEDIIDGENGKQMLTKLVSNHCSLLKIEKSTGQLLVITVDYLMEDVYKEIKQFLDLHIIVEEFLDVNSGTLSFINQFLIDKLDEIENQYRSLSVVVEQKELHYRQGFKVKGQKRSCRLAINKLQKLTESVCSEEYQLESQEVDLRQFFECSQGRTELLNIELAEKCVLKIEPDREMPLPHSRINLVQEFAECVVNGCKIIVVQGDISELHEKTDVIVSPRNMYMSNNEGVAGAIIHKVPDLNVAVTLGKYDRSLFHTEVDKGGYDIQKECELYLNKHKLFYGDVFVGGAGQLHCRNIFHVIAPEWRGGSQNEENLLRITIENCLNQMSGKKLSSIAFPAIGTGRFRFPLNKALSNVVVALRSALNESNKQIVQEIYLCATKHDIIRGFIMELKKNFGNVKDTSPTERKTNDRGKRRSEEENISSPDGKIGHLRNKSSARDFDSKIKIEVIKGELVGQKADVIVNSTNTNLDLKVGSISRSLLKAGGETILQELQRKYPEGIKPGSVAVSTGGNLHCREIYHGVLSKWEGGHETAKRVMEVFVQLCLEMADERGMTSIAFPALGTGILGVPADVVARLLFATILNYEADNPNTRIRRVFLVVYQDDQLTIQAFSSVEDKIQSGRLESRQFGGKQIFSLAKTYSMLPADVIKSHQFNIGPVTVTILQGDITKEKTDVVVNSTIEDLNLATGTVSKAILTAAGPLLQIECHRPGNRVQMKEKGFIMTGAGNMMCSKILHIKARSSPSNWEATVMRCLKEIEDGGYSSVSFPALGTGGKGCSPDSVAKVVFSAFKNYIQSSDYKSLLKAIRIVIFQADMVRVFEEASKEDPKNSRRFFEKFGQKPKLSRITFRIFASSLYFIREAKRSLDDIFTEEKLHLRKQIADDLRDRQVEKIKKMAQSKSVGIKITNKGKIKLVGSKVCVKQAVDEISGYLLNIEKDSDARRAAEAAAKGTISLPKSWGTIKLTDATKVISLSPGDGDYITVSRKLMAEARGIVMNILKIERIQNPTVYTQYAAKKKQMERSNPGGNIEKILWHGTNRQFVDIINNKGFDSNYNTVESHGVGVYFSVSAATSVQGYCRADAMGQKHIYLARVLTGDFCVGQGASRLPPQKPTGNPLDRYDSTTDNIMAPNFFVIFHEAQAYPEFLITFQ